MRIISLLLTMCLFGTITFAQSTLPNLKANTIEGKKWQLYEELQKGKSVLLDFWWIECYNCIVWAPHVEQLYQDYNQNREELFVMGLNIMKSGTNENADIKEVKDDAGWNYPDAGWENNTSNGNNKFHTWWAYNINPITQSNGFGQCVLIVPNLNDISKSKVKWFGYGKMGSKEYQEIKDALLTEGSREIWKNAGGVVGVEETDWTAGIEIFPNPANEWVQFRLNSDLQDANIQIRDLSGRKIYEKSTLNGSVQISLSDFQPGMYLASITHNGNQETRTLIVR